MTDITLPPLPAPTVVWTPVPYSIPIDTYTAEQMRGYARAALAAASAAIPKADAGAGRASIADLDWHDHNGRKR